MEVPFVDLPCNVKKYQKEIYNIVDDVIIERADFIMRADLLKFEKNFATFVGVKHAIGVANGSDALNLCVKALGIGPGDEIITVSHTFVATIAAIYHAGATPVLIDVADDYNMDVNELETAITGKTKAIMPVHLNGRICNMGKIMQVASEHNLAVIEDAAQVMGAEYEGRKAGSFGILSTTSFYPFKLIGCFGDGGMILTDDVQLDYKLRCLRDNGQNRSTGVIEYHGWNSRLDNLQAAILDMRLKYLLKDILRRREVAKLYNDGLVNIEELKVPPYDDNEYYDVFQNYVIRTQKRDELVKYLDENGIGTLISWPMPTHFHANLGLQHFSLPNTEAISREVVSLPMNTEVTDEQVEYIISTICRFFAMH